MRLLFLFVLFAFSARASFAQDCQLLDHPSREMDELQANLQQLVSSCREFNNLVSQADNMFREGKIRNHSSAPRQFSSFSERTTQCKNLSRTSVLIQRFQDNRANDSSYEQRHRNLHELLFHVNQNAQVDALVNVTWGENTGQMRLNLSRASSAVVTLAEDIARKIRRVAQHYRCVNIRAGVETQEVISGPQIQEVQCKILPGHLDLIGRAQALYQRFVSAEVRFNASEQARAQAPIRNNDEFKNIVNQLSQYNLRSITLLGSQVAKINAYNAVIELLDQFYVKVSASESGVAEDQAALNHYKLSIRQLKAHISQFIDHYDCRRQMIAAQQQSPASAIQDSNDRRGQVEFSTNQESEEVNSSSGQSEN